MSTQMTLGEIKDCYLDKLPGNCNMPSDEFLRVLNAALERLYTKTAQHGNYCEIVVVPASNQVQVDMSEYAHLVAFRIDDCDPNYRIIPLIEQWNDRKAGYNSFVDLGINKVDRTLRNYKIPECYNDVDESTYEVKALAKLKYVPLLDDLDTVDVRSKASVKNAMIAILHEEASDPDTSNKYWQIAINEGNEADQEFRGPVVPTITFHDPAITDATRQIL